jgi:hypothetical protein
MGPTHNCEGRWLTLFTFAFGTRVVGQALQRWAPQSFLPPFEAFQGSNLPCAVLLTIQLSILGLMTKATWHVTNGKMQGDRRTGQILAWSGGVYLALSLIRIAIGLISTTAHPWFRSWIPAFFHLILAGFVLVLACYHRRHSSSLH